MSERLGLTDWTLVATEAWMWGAPAVVFAVYAIIYASAPVAAAVLGAITALLAWLACRRVRRLVTGSLWHARHDLNRALKHMRLRTAYLVRDDHVFLYRNTMRVAGVPFIVLTRLAEDDAQDFFEAGEGIVTGETFKVSPVHLRVIAQATGTKLVTTADDDIEISPEAPRSRKERLRGNATILDMLRRGVLYASPDELRALTAQILAGEGPPDAPA